MRKSRRIVPQPACESSPVDGFVKLAASCMEAHSVVLLAANRRRDSLKIVAYNSLSDKLLPDVEMPVEHSAIGEIFHKGMPVYEADPERASGDISLYSGKVRLTAYVAVPLGTWGLLWVDSQQASGFSAKHLRLVLQLALVAQGIPELKQFAEERGDPEQKIELLTNLLKTNGKRGFDLHALLDNVVSAVVTNMPVDGAILAEAVPERDLLKIIACAGFSPLVEKGRIVRLKRGWAQWTLENDSAVIISERRAGEGPLTLFHVGENLGYEVKALAVIPWNEVDEIGRGILAIVSRTPCPRLEEDRDTWHLLARFVGLLRSISYREALVRGVRKYDSESGVLNESAFYQYVRSAFHRAMDRKGNLFLFLTEICNIHDLYVSMDHILVRRFLQNFVDKLQVLTKRSVVIGKFKSGGFGLAVESMPSDEAIAVTKKAASLLEGGVAVIDGYEVRYEATFGSVFYPDDAPDLRRLWKSAQDRLSGKESA